MFTDTKKRFWKSYRRARQDAQDVAPYYVVGNGVMVTKADEVVRSRSFQAQLKASAELERQLTDPLS